MALAAATTALAYSATICTPRAVASSSRQAHSCAPAGVDNATSANLSLAQIRDQVEQGDCTCTRLFDQKILEGIMNLRVGELRSVNGKTVGYADSAANLKSTVRLVLMKNPVVTATYPRIIPGGPTHVYRRNNHDYAMG